MSGDGKVVIGKNGGSNRQKVWTEEAGYLTEYTTTFKDVSQNGKYVVTSYDLINLETREERPIDYSSSRVEPVAVNSDGVVVGTRQYDTHVREATMWRNGEPFNLGLLGPKDANNAQSIPFDMTENAKIVVGRSSVSIDVSPARGVAFIWDEVNGMRNLESVLENEFNVDLNGWRLTTATAISDDGYHIAGVGWDAEGNYGYWMAALVAECTASSW